MILYIITKSVTFSTEVWSFKMHAHTINYNASWENIFITCFTLHIKLHHICLGCGLVSLELGILEQPCKFTVKRMQYESAAAHVYFPGTSTSFVLVLCFPQHCLLYKTKVNGWHAEVASYSEINMVLSASRADLWKAFIQTVISWIDAHLRCGQFVMHHSI